MTKIRSYKGIAVLEALVYQKEFVGVRVLTVEGGSRILSDVAFEELDGLIEQEDLITFKRSYLIPNGELLQTHREMQEGFEVRDMSDDWGFVKAVAAAIEHLKVIRYTNVRKVPNSCSILEPIFEVTVKDNTRPAISKDTITTIPVHSVSIQLARAGVRTMFAKARRTTDAYIEVLDCKEIKFH